MRGKRKIRSGAQRARSPENGWLFGRHAVAAALANPARRRRRLLATAEGAARLPAAGAEIVERPVLDAALPAGAVHQGVALLADPLPEVRLAEIAARSPERAAMVALDRVTDPRNVGAVLRSAGAFGASAVIVADRHAPEATGTLAKAASGALETVPLARAGNLARALRTLKEAGFWIVGLDAEAPQDLADLPGRCALVLGAEGTGLRRLTRETCDLTARVAGAGGSLNVSATAAVALYEWSTRGGR